jgi:HEPN domain-containing protein
VANKIFRASDGYDPVDLLKYSRDHFLATKLLFDSHFQYYDSAAHLAHLSIELLLKAVLLERDGQFQAEHRLSKLVEQLQERESPFKLSVRGKTTLTMLEEYQSTRYPNPSNPIEVGSEDFPAISALWHELVAELPKPLFDSFVSADKLTKGARVLMVKDTDVRPSGSA